jgi:GntR family transcriptional regulator
MINIIISNTSDKPIYQQIFDQISAQIIKGEMESNFILPAIRTVAKELRVSVITIKKAWEELERQGFIYTMVGKGCFVAELSSSDIKDKQTKLVRKRLLKDIDYYKELGITLSEIIKLFKDNF